MARYTLPLGLDLLLAPGFSLLVSHMSSAFFCSRGSFSISLSQQTARRPLDAGLLLSHLADSGFSLVKIKSLGAPPGSKSAQQLEAYDLLYCGVL